MPDICDSHMIAYNEAAAILVRMYRRRLQEDSDYLLKQWREHIDPEGEMTHYHNDVVILVPRVDND